MKKLFQFFFLFNLCASTGFSQTAFTNVSQSAGISHLFNVGDFHFGGGLCAFDFDIDGDEDIYMVGGTNPDKLYRNNGNGTFTDVRIAAGITLTDGVLTTGCAAGDIDNDGDRDLFITTRCAVNNLNLYVPNLFFRNNGNGTFTDISAISGIGLDSAFSNAVTFGDVNQDGFLDIYVSNYFETLVYDIYDTTGLDTTPVVFNGKRNYLYINNRNNTFTETGQSTGVANTGCTWQSVLSDMDNDNDPDIFVANDFGMETGPNWLYRNNNTNSLFSDIAVSSGINDSIYGMGIGVGDYNEDGWLDYYMTNMGDKYLHRNNGNGTFSNQGPIAGVRGENLTIPNSEYTCFTYTPNPGFVGWDTVDFSICDTAMGSCDTIHIVFMCDTMMMHMMGMMGMGSMDSVSGAFVFIHTMTDSFVIRCPVEVVSGGDTAVIAAISSPSNGILSIGNDYSVMSVSWGAVFVDYNHDTWLDLYVSNGVLTPFILGDMVYNPNSLFQNNGNGTFADVSIGSGAEDKWAARGAISSDFDNDGDMDFFVINQEYPTAFAPGFNPNSALLRNNNSTGNYLKVKLRGTWTNRDGIGCRVRIVAGGRSFIREIDGGSSTASQNSIIAHFGLGSFNLVDTVEVTWRGGFKQIQTGVTVNQQISIVESNPLGLSDPMAESLKVYPNPFKNSILIELKLSDSHNMSFRLSDLSGKILRIENRQVNEGIQKIFLEELENISHGMYILTVSDEKENISFKLIKE